MILHIETATKICSVALSSNGKIIGSIEKSENDFIHGEALTLLIIDLLENSKVNIKELKAVSVAIGPGSYTGLRIGLATAKGLCFGLGIPLIPISSLESLERIALEKHPVKTIVSVFDARRDEVFCRIREANGTLLLEDSPIILTKESFKDLVHAICVGENLTKVSMLTQHPNLFLDAELQCSALGQVALASLAFNNNQFANLATITPNYTKEVYINQGLSG